MIPTPEGELILSHARRILQLNTELIGRIAEPELSGLVRIGAPEDFATTHLQGVLAKFTHSHPRIALEMTCELTMQLLDRFAAGGLDLALVKREPAAEAAGRLVWRETLVWVASRDIDWTEDRVSLVVSPAPCVYRKRATDALDTARIDWRIAYTCGALSGSLAAVRAGMGITVLPKDMVPPDLIVLDPAGDRLPMLEDTEIILLEAAHIGAPAARLRDVIEHALHRGTG